MPITDAFLYCIELIVRRPTIILPALAIIFLTSVVIHGVLVLSLSVAFHGSWNLSFEISVIVLLVSVIIGIFLSGFYVGVAKHDVKRGAFSLGAAFKDVRENSGSIGWIGSVVLATYAIMLGCAGIAIYYGYHYIGLYTLGFDILAVVALLFIAAFAYLSVLFYEINLAIIVEGLAGMKAVERTWAMARDGNMPSFLIAIVLIGILYFGVYYIFSLTGQHITDATEHIVFSYASIIPYAIVTAIFDLMPAAMYYKHVL
ncbi:MAG: hypothetical protein KGH72_04795, partial [Candidatus Micrarchaeota archaeon]|nr:hypothetical protein [Candidatus Micrarchaeota archaeon]